MGKSPPWISMTMNLCSYSCLSAAPVLYCYVCDDCPERKLEPLRHMAACPDEKHVSCIASLTTFGEHKSESRENTGTCKHLIVSS